MKKTFFITLLVLFQIIAYAQTDSIAKKLFLGKFCRKILSSH